ncbi:MAG: methionyl-tRNA formyltransferase [Muribaculaceae bacterium]|nr:methionyl-tRNA formyltransferase [Muribaculaceae bacterium]
MKIVFFGTPEFAVASLRAIIGAGYDVCAVVTAPDRTGGRGNKLIESDVKKYAVEKGIPVLQPEKLRDPQFIDTLRSLEADLFVVIAFRMLPEMVWSLPRLGTFNLHASLLPQLRGAAPINHAIISGFKSTGVTTFLINAEIDKGEILLSESTSISDEDDAGMLHDRLMGIGAGLVLKTIKGLEDGTLVPTPQPQADVFTPAPKIFKTDCKINFTQPAKIISRQIRGLSPYPGAWCTLRLADDKEIEVKVLKARAEYISLGLEPGTCVIKNKTFLVATGDGAIEIQQLQPAGKKPMDAKAFMAGYHPHQFI